MSFCWCFGLCFHVCAVVGTAFLAQARLTEARPDFCVQTVAQATGFLFERGVISPRREWTRLSEKPQRPLYKSSSSRLGEEELARVRLGQLGAKG